MKYKILLILLVLILLILGFGLTYSFFYSSSKLDSNEKDIAKFIFNVEDYNEFDIPLIGLTPGDIEEYSFSISNNYSGEISDVLVEYQITIKTYNFIPLIIELYAIDALEEAELIFICDETYDRDLQNAIVCVSPIQEMGYTEEEINNYKIRVEFDSDYSDEIYSGLVDYIYVEINSSQKIED